MTLKEKREERIKAKEEKERIKNINWYIFHLNRECNIKYDNVTVEDKLYANGQQYAAMMSDTLEYYKTKNPKICETVIEVVNRYGKKAYRHDPRGGRFCETAYVIQLIIPEEIGVKIKALYDKMLKDKKTEQTDLASKLDELIK